MLLLLYVPQQELFDRPWSPAANQPVYTGFFLNGTVPERREHQGQDDFLGIPQRNDINTAWISG